jgi:hypothetical protein
MDKLEQLVQRIEELHGASAKPDWDILHELHRQAAEEFAKGRGWRVSRSSKGFKFSLPAELYDHVYFFRQDRKPFAVVAHLYMRPEVEEALRKIPHEQILSWWNPGVTIGVLFRV